MNGKAVIFGAVVAAILCGDRVQAQEKEPTAIVAIGPAWEWSLPNPAMRVGPSASVEFSLIKEWLEVEVGGDTLFRKGQPEWEADVLFKKPFTLSETAELMLGAGPSWSSSRGETGQTGIIFVADFMFWPWPERKFGWFLEPTYSYSFGKEHEKSVAVSVGLLITIP